MHDEDKGSSPSEFRTTGEIEIDMTVDNFFLFAKTLRAVAIYLLPMWFGLPEEARRYVSSASLKFRLAKREENIAQLISLHHL